MIYHRIRNTVVPGVSVLIIVGAALFSLIAPAPKAPELSAAEGARAKVTGVVVTDPDWRENQVRLTVKPETINATTVNRSGSRIIVSTERFVDVMYGDRIEAIGVLEKPEAFETDTGRTFNYPRFLQAHGISHHISFAHLTVISHGNGNPVITSLLSVKHALLRGMEKALPEPESALLAGLLLGEKQSLGEHITEAFRKAGVVHIIVLSGYNVAIVIAVIAYLASALFPRAAAIGISMVGVVAFALMTGASETTVRASVMALLVLLARLFHRPQVALRLLLIAAAGMALWNPDLVLFDLSYQLSILATLGLILFTDPIAARLRFITNQLKFREIVATTIGTHLTVLPLLILSIGQVSLVALPANVLVLPAVEAAMLVGFIASCIALVSTTLAFPVSMLAYGILKYIIAVSVFFGTLPFSAVDIPPAFTWVAFGALLVLYVALFLLITRRIALKSLRH